MTKLEICAIEDVNPGQVYLYPEGAFYKAYQKSAWILCTKVHPFKVSSRSLKGLEGPLLSVGFPQSSLEKFSVGLVVAENGGGKILSFSELVDFSLYGEWRNCFAVPSVTQRKEPHFNTLPVYGMAYRLAVEATEMASRIERNYRYSLGEDIRKGAKSAVLSIILAGKGENRADNIHSALITILDIQLSLRLLNDLKVLPDKRYVYFLESTEKVLKQLSNWERSERQHLAGMPSPP